MTSAHVHFFRCVHNKTRENAPFNFNMSVCPSTKTTQEQLKIFYEILCWGFLLKFVYTLLFWLRSDIHNGSLYEELHAFCDHRSWVTSMCGISRLSYN
jgi:hypothetical protein